MRDDRSTTSLSGSVVQRKLVVPFLSISFFQNFSALMSGDEEVSQAELFELLKYFSKYPYRARDTNPKVRACLPQDRLKLATAAHFLTILVVTMIITILIIIFIGRRNTKKVFTVVRKGLQVYGGSFDRPILR